jgi:hypothetical protein
MWGRKVTRRRFALTCAAKLFVKGEPPPTAATIAAAYPFTSPHFHGLWRDVTREARHAHEAGLSVVPTRRARHVAPAAKPPEFRLDPE